MIDTYSLRARIYPMVIFLLPLIIISTIYSLEFDSLKSLLSSIILMGALSYLFSQFGRDKGKRKEPALWKHWGGAPTSQLLSFENTRIDQNTKKRYHSKLQQLCPVNPVPTIGLEKSNRPAVEQSYAAWVKYIISKTRSTKDYSLLFKDNTSYGFRRNLWGLKTASIILIALTIVVNYFAWSIKVGSYDPKTFSTNFIIANGAMFVLLAFWIFLINRTWVKIPAFSYAERLLEAIDTLS